MKIKKINSVIEDIVFSKMEAKDTCLTLAWEIMRLNKKVDELVEELNNRKDK